MIVSHSILAAIAALNALVTYQDFRYRLISAWIIPALIILCVSFLWQAEQLSFLKSHLVFNLGYLAILILGILIYSFLKFKKFTNPFDQLIGWGDILILLTFAFVFESKSYVFFVTLSSILSLILAIAMSKAKPKKKVLFPFAGMMSLVFLLIGITSIVSGDSSSPFEIINSYLF